MTPAFTHVLWDLDGTLLDTYPATDRALSVALGRLGHTVTVDAVRPLTRRTLDEAIRVLAARFEMPAAQVYAAYGREYALTGHQPAPAMPGAVQAMAAVRSAGGLNLLATHRDREGATWRLQAAGLHALLDDLLSVSDGYPRKPDPAMFVALLDRHQLDPGTVLVVGDRDLDVVAGHAAGCRAALLLTPGAELQTGADMRLDSLCGLVPMVGGASCSG